MLSVLLENVLVTDCYTDNLSGCHVEQRVFKDLLTKKCPRFGLFTLDEQFFKKKNPQKPIFFFKMCLLVCIFHKFPSLFCSLHFLFPQGVILFLCVCVCVCASPIMLYLPCKIGNSSSAILLRLLYFILFLAIAISSTSCNSYPLRYLIGKCRIAAHLELMGFDASLVATEWFLCLFSKSLPSEVWFVIS